MDKIKIDDNKNMIKIAIDDLAALQMVLQEAIDRKDYSNSQELLIVTVRVLNSITKELYESILSITEALSQK